MKLKYRPGLLGMLVCALVAGHDVYAQYDTAFTTSSFRADRTGYTIRDFADSSRNNWTGNGPRPLTVVIWYPSPTEGKKEMINDPGQFAPPGVTVFSEGRIGRAGKKYPLILISHGSGGNALQMRWLGYYLASRGYITVAVNHNGKPEEEGQVPSMPLSEFCMWVRPRDISVVLDKMLADPSFAGRIDTSRIAVAGFSLGGATAIWVAGAVLDIKQLAKNAGTPPPEMQEAINRQIELTSKDPLIQEFGKHAGDSYKDNRIKAVFALSPAIGQGFTEEGLQAINVPVQIVVGDADLITPLQQNAQHYTCYIRSARPLIVFPGELGHYTRPAVGGERPFELRKVSELAYQFFNDVFRK